MVDEREADGCRPFFIGGEWDLNKITKILLVYGIVVVHFFKSDNSFTNIWNNCGAFR